jgi:hypothetical protein
MRNSLLVASIGAALSLNSVFAIGGTSDSTNFSRLGGKLIEGRAVYEAQVSFGGARENDLGPGFDFGVPGRSPLRRR